MARLCTVVVSVAIACGCAAMGGGSSDERLIVDMLETWVEAYETGNVDTMATLFADGYQHDQFGGKDSYVATMEGIFAETDMEATFDADSISVDGDEATVDVVLDSSAYGEYPYTLKLKKVAGTWLILHQGQ